MRHVCTASRLARQVLSSSSGRSTATNAARAYATRRPPSENTTDSASSSQRGTEEQGPLYEERSGGSTGLATPACSVASLDHIVLTVASIPATVDFYTSKLGMRHETFGKEPQRHSLKFGSQKINLHEQGNEFEPKAATALPGTADLCFLTENKVEDVKDELEQAGVDVMHAEDGQQLVDRTGATGSLRSLYLRDPDGNLIEISNTV